MQWTIRYANPSDDASWNAYVRNHPHGTVFHLLEWKEAVRDTFDHRPLYLLAEAGSSQGGNENAILGILPLFEIKSRIFGHSLVSVPFAELGGPLADSEEILNGLIDRAAAEAKALGGAYTELRNRQAIDGLPTKSLYSNFRKVISPDPEENLQAIPRKQRRMVRVGLKSGLKAEVGHDEIETFYRLLATNFHRLGTPIFPIALFQNFLSRFGDKAQILLVKDEADTPIAGVLSFFYRDTVLPYYAGSLAEHRHLAPNDFMYWQLMEYGREHGYAVFDFGRSKEGTGSFKFKKHWGFEPEPLAYQYILNTASEIPDISPNNPKYQKKIEMWRRLPFWATKMIGPKVAKYLC
jgi:FemAB-related protein (PEP-CTERM system-associated)